METFWHWMHARARGILRQLNIASTMTNERVKSHFAMGKHRIQAFIFYSWTTREEENRREWIKFLPSTMTQKSGDLFQCLCWGTFCSNMRKENHQLGSFAHWNIWNFLFFNSHGTCVAYKGKSGWDGKTSAFVDVASDIFPLPSFVQLDFSTLYMLLEYNWTETFVYA